MLLLVAAVPVLLLSTAAAAVPVAVDWGACPLRRTTAVSALVAADPEWVSAADSPAAGGVLAATAVGGVASLVAEGADNMRLLNFNIFPLLSCAQVHEGHWDFTLVDQVVVPFLRAANGTQTIVDIETSPLWMWYVGGNLPSPAPMCL
jgi:hypothetical protein